MPRRMCPGGRLRSFVVFGIRNSELGTRNSDFGIRTKDFGIRTSHFRIPNSEFRLSTALCPLPSADCRLPTAYCKERRGLRQEGHRWFGAFGRLLPAPAPFSTGRRLERPPWGRHGKGDFESRPVNRRPAGRRRRCRTAASAPDAAPPVPKTSWTMASNWSKPAAEPTASCIRETPSRDKPTSRSRSSTTSRCVPGTAPARSAARWRRRQR